MRSKRRYLPYIIAGLALMGGALAYLGAKPALESLLAASVPKIEAFATGILGSEVRFDRIEPSLDWARPRFRIVNPRIEENGKIVASAEAIILEVDALATFQEKRLRIGGLVVLRPEFEVQERTPGKWIIRGLRSLFHAEHPAPRTEEWIKPDLAIRIQSAGVRITPWDGKGSRAMIERTRLRLLGGNEGTRATIEAGFGDSAKGMTLRGELRIPDPGAVELSLRVDQVEARTLLELVPAAILGEALKDWLSSSVISGRVRSADLEYIAGSADTRDARKAKINTSIALRDLVLDYRANWPRFTSGEIQMSYDGTRVVIDAPSATWSGMRLESVRAEVADTAASSMAIDISADAEATGSRLTEFLSDGPLKEQASKILAWVKPQGTFEGKVRLHVPLDGDTATRGSFDIKKGSARWLDPEIDFQDLNGEMSFGAGKFTLRGLHARAFENEFTLDGEGTESNYAIAGALPWDQIRTWLPSIPKKEILDGVLPFLVKVEIKPAGAEAQAHWSVKGETDFKGTAIALPEPLVKDAAGKWASSFSASGSGRDLRAFRAEILRKSNIKRLTLDYRSSAGERDLTGRIVGGQADVSEWIEAIRGMADATDPELPTGANQNIEQTPPVRLSLRAALDALKWKDLTFDSIEGTLERMGPKWSFGLRSLELEGSVEVSQPLSQNILTAKFSKVILPKFPKDPSSSEDTEMDEDLEEGWDLSRWPSIDLLIDRLRVGPQLYGKLDFEARQTGSMLKLEKLHVEGPELTILSERGECGYTSFKQCSLTGSMTIDRTTFPTRLKSLQELELRRSEFRYKLFWPGGPEAFSMRRLSGATVGTIREGALKGVTSSAMKIFNMLSFETSDNDRRISRFYKASVKAEFRKGSILLDPFTALFGSVWFRLSGPGRFKDKQLEMKARVKLSVPDIPLPPMPPLEGNWTPEPEPDGFLGHSYFVEGTWDKPSVSLKIF